MNDSSLSTCKECGGKIERIITGGTGLIFKGSGFYLTDYKDEKKTKQDNGNTKQSKTDKKEVKNSKLENKSTSKKVDKSDE